MAAGRRGRTGHHHLGLDRYAERFEGLAGFGFAEAVERATAYLRPAEDVTPQAVDQLLGMAEGANVRFDHLFALNCSEEFTCQADWTWPPEHCTSFAVVADERPVAGHNEDSYPEEIEAQTIRVVRLKRRWSTAAYISAGPAYNLPITGVTAAGFSSAANTVYYRDERVGVPNNFLLATVLGQPDLEHARDLLGGDAAGPRFEPPALRCARTGVGRGDDRREVGVLGWRAGAGRGGRASAPRRSSRTPTTTCRLSSRRATPSHSEGSRLRRERAEQLLLEGLTAGTDLVELGKRVLSDHENAPFSICDHWEDDDPDPDQSVTTASMVWEPAEGRAHIAGGQPCEAEYLTSCSEPRQAARVGRA